MNTYEVSTITHIDFGAEGIQEILQNVRFILSTMTHSCPMNREFAWNVDVDEPMNILKVRLIPRVMDVVEKYEPRVRVVNVTFEEDALNGQLKPIVRVRINEEAS